MFNEAWETAFSVANIRSGVRVCGIFPFNPFAKPNRMLVPSKPPERNYDSLSRYLKPKGEKSRVVLPQLVCEGTSTNVECFQVPVSADPIKAMSAKCAIEDPNILFDLILGGQCELFSPDAGDIANIPQKGRPR